MSTEDHDNPEQENSDIENASLPEYDQVREKLFRAEIRWIKKRREILKSLLDDEASDRLQTNLGRPHDRPSCDHYDLEGLALSGGGIRSAAFSLGVLQAMAEHRWLERMDFLSTVSGGGYIGATTSLLLRGHPSVKNRKPRVPDKAGFPLHFRYIPRGVKRQHQSGYTEPQALQAIRDRADYLRGPGLDFFLSMVQAVVVTLVNLLFLTSMLAFLAAFYCLVLTISNLVAGYVFDDPWLTSKGFDLEEWGLGLIGLMGAYAFLCVLFVIAFSHAENKTRVRKAMSLFFFALTIFSVLYLFAPVVDVIHWLLISNDFNTGVSTILGGGALAVGARFIAGLKSLPKHRSVRAIRLLFLLVVPAFMVLGIGWFCGWVWWGTGSHDGPSTSIALPTQEMWLRLLALIGVGLVGLIVGFLININDTSPHAIYRNRLARTFLFRIELNGQLIDRRVHNIRLSKMCKPDLPTLMPYPIINAAVNLPGSQDESLRGRQAENFIFTPNYVGSQRADYCATDQFEKRNKHFSLASAIATSGAAVSSNMGEKSGPLTRLTMSVLNARLGLWVVNPNSFKAAASLDRATRLAKASWKSKRLGKRLKPTAKALPMRWTDGHLIYLLIEAMGRASLKHHMLNISDGGHIENLGAYELLRRQCRRIIIVDAEADPNMTFHGLAKLIRMARTDLSIDIDIDLDPLRLDPTEADEFRKRCSQQQAVAGTITYPGMKQKGELIYVKSSMTGDENPYIRHTAANDTTFPHTSTANQFFDESVFEAYRALGYRAGRGAFNGGYVPPAPNKWRWDRKQEFSKQKPRRQAKRTSRYRSVKGGRVSC